MRTTSGRVVAGKILVEGEPLLDPFAEAELLESIAEADRGDLIPAEKVLRSLWLVTSDPNCKGE